MNQPLLKSRLQKVEVSTEDQIRFYEQRVSELKEQHVIEQEEAVKTEVELLQKVAALGYTISEKQTTEEEEEPSAWYYDVSNWVKSLFGSGSVKVSSSAGMWTMIFSLATLILGFAWYPVFFKLNDSEIRIHNAATLHFFSHVWMGMAVLLLGFGFQFLGFNEHFRYLWTDIKTEKSATEDFRSGDAQAKVRLATALFTWAFPVWIITQMFQFILG